MYMRRRIVLTNNFANNLGVEIDSKVFFRCNFNKCYAMHQTRDQPYNKL
jgi:hypothetical protein